MSSVCILEVKNLRSQTHVLVDVNLDETVSDLCERVSLVETTQTGKWKLMLVTPSMRTLRPSDGHKRLRDYGAEAEQKYRLEVILDMGACHTTCKL